MRVESWHIVRGMTVLLSVSVGLTTVKKLILEVPFSFFLFFLFFFFFFLLSLSIF